MEPHVVIQIVLQLAATVAMVGFGVGTVWSRMSARMDAAAHTARALADAVAKDTQAEIAAVHSRINEVRDQYVRRDDFADAMRRIEAGQNATTNELSRLRHEQRSTATTIAAIAAKLNVDDLAARQRPSGED